MGSLLSQVHILMWQLIQQDNIYVANTGHRRIETRGIDGATISYFGEPGTAPDAFCGCCNPAHFVKTKRVYYC